MLNGSTLHWTSSCCWKGYLSPIRPNKVRLFGFAIIGTIDPLSRKCPVTVIPVSDSVNRLTMLRNKEVCEQIKPQHTFGCWRDICSCHKPPSRFLHIARQRSRADVGQIPYCGAYWTRGIHSASAWTCPQMLFAFPCLYKKHSVLIQVRLEYWIKRVFLLLVVDCTNDCYLIPSSQKLRREFLSCAVDGPSWFGRFGLSLAASRWPLQPPWGWVGCPGPGCAIQPPGGRP